MNLRKTAKRLQQALCLRGRYIQINQRQYYSEKTGRMGTIYTVCESVEGDDGKRHRQVYAESPVFGDVVTALVSLYNSGGG